MSVKKKVARWEEHGMKGVRKVVRFTLQREESEKQDAQMQQGWSQVWRCQGVELTRKNMDRVLRYLIPVQRLM